jgi:hypothetical protein
MLHVQVNVHFNMFFRLHDFEKVNDAISIVVSSMSYLAMLISPHADESTLTTEARLGGKALHPYLVDTSIIHWIGLRGNSRRTALYLMVKTLAFSIRFSLKPIQ